MNSVRSVWTFESGELERFTMSARFHMLFTANYILALVLYFWWINVHINSNETWSMTGSGIVSLVAIESVLD